MYLPGLGFGYAYGYFEFNSLALILFDFNTISTKFPFHFLFDLFLYYFEGVKVSCPQTILRAWGVLSGPVATMVSAYMPACRALQQSFLPRVLVLGGSLGRSPESVLSGVLFEISMIF